MLLLNLKTTQNFAFFLISYYNISYLKFVPSHSLTAMDGQICGTKCLIPKGKRQASFSHTLRSVVHEVNTEMRPLFLPAGGCFEEVKNNGNSKTVIITSGPIGCLQEVALYWRFQL